MTINLNGADISNSVNWRDIDLVSVLTKENSSLAFSVMQGVGQTYPVIAVPVVGDTVEMSDTSGKIFGGTITQVEATVSGLVISYAITASDWGYLFDGALVRKNYTAQDPADIVADIVSTFCSGKGFTTTHVQRGNFQIPSIKFNYQQPTKCLQSLANLIGWDWYIDSDKDVHFFLGDVDNGIGENGAAPIIIDQTGGNSGQDIEWNSLDVNLNLQNMQNSAYVIGGNYKKTFTAATTPDTYQTNGVAQVFPLSYPYESSQIQVTLAGTTQTVGVDGSADPTTVDVLYNDANRNIRFTSGAPASSQTVKIYGEALVPIVAHAGDAASITAYGEYQTAIVDSKITTVAEAQARARAAILQFGNPVYDIKVTTLVPGCAIGQAIYVNLPAFGVNTKWLVIKRIEATTRAPGASGKMAYQLECIGGDNATFVDIMSTLLQQEASQTDVADSTITEVLQLTPEEKLALTESLTATSSAHTTFKWDGNSKWGFFTWN